jgi:hypothetical protein
MNTLALGQISQQTIFAAAKPAQADVRRGKRAINFSQTILGSLLDFFGSAVVGAISAKLELDSLTLRGLCSVVNDADGVIVDPKHEASRLLIGLERNVRKLRTLAAQAQTKRSLRKTQNAMAKLVQVSDALERVVIELKLAITEHDAKVAVQTEGTGQLAYKLSDQQVEQFEGCITSERAPTARMREASRRYATQVTSR